QSVHDGSANPESALPRKASHFRNSSHRSASQMVDQLQRSSRTAPPPRHAARLDSFLSSRAYGLRSAGIGGSRHRSGKPAQISSGGSPTPPARRQKSSERCCPHRFFRV